MENSIGVLDDTMSSNTRADNRKNFSKTQYIKSGPTTKENSQPLSNHLATTSVNIVPVKKRHRESEIKTQQERRLKQQKSNDEAFTFNLKATSSANTPMVDEPTIKLETDEALDLFRLREVDIASGREIVHRADFLEINQTFLSALTPKPTFGSIPQSYPSLDSKISWALIGSFKTVAEAGITWKELRISTGSPLQLIREQQNPYNKNAVLVCALTQKHAGHLHPQLELILAPYMDSGTIRLEAHADEPRARVTSVPQAGIYVDVFARCPVNISIDDIFGSRFGM